MLPYLRAARSFQRPPLTVIVGRPDTWREEDTMLAVALDLYESTRLDHMGLPKRLTEEGDNEGYWEVETKQNAAQLAQDLYAQEQDGEPDPGTVTYLKDTRTDG